MSAAHRPSRGAASGSPNSRSGAGVVLALSPNQAAAALGVSRDFLDEHVMPELRVVRRGRRKLVAVRELERWLETAAERTLEPT